jgi:hypothetical protein
MAVMRVTLRIICFSLVLPLNCALILQIVRKVFEGYSTMHELHTLHTLHTPTTCSHAYIPTCIVDVLWCQSIKLIQVVSTSEFHEY